MLKTLFLVILSLFFISCSSSVNSIKLGSINISISKEKNSQIGSCIDDAYTFEKTDKAYGKIFIEFISTSSSCVWKANARSYFEDLFKNTLKITSMEVLERYDFSNYEITTYLINNSSYIDLIYMFEFKNDTFILDYDGKLSNELLSKYIKNYENKYINKKRFDKSYDNSLVKMNFINKYFIRELEED